MNAHLVLDRAAHHAVAPGESAVRVHGVSARRTGKCPCALGRALDAGENQVHDVLDHVVLAGRNEDLGAGDGVGPVAVRHRLRLEQPEIRAAMGLGQVHGSGPGALDHPGQISPLLFLRSVHQERRDGALRQARIHAEGEVRRGDELLHYGVEVIGRPCPPYSVGAEAHPTALRIGPVGLLEPFRVARAVRMALAALLVADPVEGREHFLGELGGFGDDRLDGVGVASAKPGRLL